MKVFASKILLSALFFAVVLTTVPFSYVEAGFGITPPYVSNTSLTRNSVYEQQILLVRSETNVAQKAEISIDAPEIQDWIEIVEGQEIRMERGVNKVPMTVRVTVPSDAEFKDYEGDIRVRTLPDDKDIRPGTVSISLGALIDVRLSVIDKQIKDFRVRKISAPDLNEGGKFAWLFFPGKIRFSILLENTGNVDIAPSKVDFRIFDRAGKVLLEETRNIGKIDKVQPYSTETVVAELPTRLPAASYMARYRIYNDDEVKQEGDISLNILAAGTLQTSGFGFIGLSMAHKISVLLPVFSIIIAAMYIIRARLRSRRERG